MSNLLVLPRQLAMTSGAFASNTLYFYEPGTSTPKAVYDVDGDSLGTSVSADSSGRYPAFYGDGLYKIIEKTSSGVTVWSADNVAGYETGSGNGSLRADLASTAAGKGGDLVKITQGCSVQDAIDSLELLDLSLSQATFDGVVDNTAILNEYLALGSVLLPMGTVLISSDIEVPSGRKIIGRSKQGSIIKLRPKTVAATLANCLTIFDKQSIYIANCTIDNSAVDDPYVATTHGGHGIEVENSRDIVIDSVIIKNALYKAVTFGACEDCYYINSRSENCGYDGWHTWGSSRMYCLNNYFYDCDNLEASGYTEGAYPAGCDDIHVKGNTFIDMRQHPAHFWGVANGWFKDNRIIFTTRTSDSNRVGFRTSNGGISGRECGTIHSKNNTAINCYRGFQYADAEIVIEEGNVQKSAYDIGFLYGAVSKHIESSGCFSYESRNDAYRVETTDNAVTVVLDNSAKGPASDTVTNSACLSVRSGTVISRCGNLERGAYSRTTWLVSTFTGTFIELKGRRSTSTTNDATGATVQLQSVFPDFYAQIGSSSDTSQEYRFFDKGHVKKYQSGGSAGKMEFDTEHASVTSDFEFKNSGSGGAARLVLAGKTIRLQRTDGTYVNLTVDNTNTLVIS